jgi:hypothetical protein
MQNMVYRVVRKCHQVNINGVSEKPALNPESEDSAFLGIVKKITIRLNGATFRTFYNLFL